MKTVDIKIFDINYLDIPLCDMNVDDIIVCLDPQKRLGDETYAVMEYSLLPKARGLFWDRDMAILFAKELYERV